MQVLIIILGQYMCLYIVGTYNMTKKETNLPFLSSIPIGILFPGSSVFSRYHNYSNFYTLGMSEVYSNTVNFCSFSVILKPTMYKNQVSSQYSNNILFHC